MPVIGNSLGGAPMSQMGRRFDAGPLGSLAPQPAAPAPQPTFTGGTLLDSAQPMQPPPSGLPFMPDQGGALVQSTPAPQFSGLPFQPPPALSGLPFMPDQGAQPQFSGLPFQPPGIASTQFGSGLQRQATPTRQPLSGGGLFGLGGGGLY